MNGPAASPAKPVRCTRMDADPRPYTRWWWFSNPMDPRDIDRQVDWCAANGFGGVEIAWVYPLPGKGPGPLFLSPEWKALVVHAREACRRAGIGCDFTFGSMWPFGGSFVEERDVSRTWRGPTGQVLDRSWETSHTRAPCRVINHLSAESLGRFADVVGGALAPALAVPGSLTAEGGPPNGAAASTCAPFGEAAASLFCDSWEVEGAGLWTPGFGEEFQERFGYDALPFMERLDEHPDVRYDYRSLLADYALREFYAPFTRICHALGAAARVQCHGAPADLLAAYAAADVPESEAVLFPPEFSSFAASAALLTGRRTVSAEAFTCLYGWVAWPNQGPHMGEERIDDLKLIADALFASGINHVVWHGMPFQGTGAAARFYATVHVGPDSAIPFGPFNAYLADMSSRMKQGRTYARVACYLPLEDVRMAGELPPELRGPSATHYWELQHLPRPAEARPYAPAWISPAFFKDMAVEDGRLLVGGAAFEALYLDSQWMDRDALAAVVGFADAGLPVVLKRGPREPGRTPTPEFAGLARRLASHPRVASSLDGVPGLEPVLRPVREIDTLPPYWVREEEGRFTVFLAHPHAAAVRYPLPFGFADGAGAVDLILRISLGRARRDVRLSFPAQGALLLSVDGERVEQSVLHWRTERRGE
jgi:hypothetical protein